MGEAGYEAILKYPFVLLSAFLATWLLTPGVMRVSAALGLLDVPDARRIHTHPVPRCGVSVFLGFHIGCAAVFLVPWTAFGSQITGAWWWNFLVLSTALLSVGLADDRWGLGPWMKLAGQTAVALAAYAMDMRMDRLLGMNLPPALDIGLTVLWFLMVINAFNLIDGLDGLATGLAAIGAMGMAGTFLFRHLPGDALVLLGLTGACMGFLRYNVHPARIFLGDSGSMFLGFTLAAVALETGAKGTAMATLGVPLLAVGVPLFDTALAIWRRSARRLAASRSTPAPDAGGGSRIFGADTDHLHHRLLRSGLSQRAVASWLHAGALTLVAIGLVSMLFRSHALGIYILAFVLGSYVAVRHLAQVELLDSSRAIAQGIRRPPNRTLAVLLYPPLDFAALCFSLAVAAFFTATGMPFDEFKLFWFDQIPVWVGVPFLAFFAVRTYRRVWSRARTSEYLLLALALVGGILAATGIALATDQYQQPMSVTVINTGGLADTTVVMGRLVPRSLALQVIIYSALSLLLVVGMRALPRAVHDSMTLTCPCHETRGRRPPRTLVYGAGYGSILFLMQRNFCLVDPRYCFQVVGIVDNDRNLHGRYVNGYRVLGGLEDLPGILSGRRTDQVVVTDAIPDAELHRLVKTASAHAVPVYAWKTVMNPAAGDLIRDTSAVGPS